VVVVVGRAIAWKVTVMSWDGTVCMVGGVLVQAVAVLFPRMEHWHL